MYKLILQVVLMKRNHSDAKKKKSVGLTILYECLKEDLPCWLHIFRGFLLIPTTQIENSQHHLVKHLNNSLS